MNSRGDDAGIDWSNGRLFPAFPVPQQLDIYDLRGAPDDVRYSVASLAGIINREQPRVYLSERRNDEFWLKGPLSAGPLRRSSLRNEAILKELLGTYRSSIHGLIIYDPTLKDSINIATMLAGQRNCMIVSPTQAPEYQQAPYNLSVLSDLRTYQWKSRLQAYRWAEQNLLSNCSTHLVAGLSPNITIGLRPFLVATQAFIYWLDPLNFWPNLSVSWLSERALMKRILSRFAPGTPHLGWFIQEGFGVILTSRNALPVYATDLFTNLEIWSSIPFSSQLPEPAIEQVPLPAVKQKVYVSFTLSEGDNLQYIQERLIQLWQDPMRGSVPIGWTTSPVLLQAAPLMAAYYARTVTPNDELIAGPSGIGYMYPSVWPQAQLPNFLRLTAQYMRAMKLSIVEVLDSNVGQNLLLMLRAFFGGSGMALIDRNVQMRFVSGAADSGMRGVLSGSGQDQASWTTIANVPLYQNVGLVGSVDQAVSLVKRATKAQRPYFINLYVLAWNLTPTQLKQVAEQLGSEYEVVTPGQLLRMIASKKV